MPGAGGTPQNSMSQQDIQPSTGLETSTLARDLQSLGRVLAEPRGLLRQSRLWLDSNAKQLTRDALSPHAAVGQDTEISRICKIKGSKNLNRRFKHYVFNILVFVFTLLLPVDQGPRTTVQPLLTRGPWSLIREGSPAAVTGSYSMQPVPPLVSGSR